MQEGTPPCSISCWGARTLMVIRLRGGISTASSVYSKCSDVSKRQVPSSRASVVNSSGFWGSGIQRSCRTPRALPSAWGSLFPASGSIPMMATSWLVFGITARAGLERRALLETSNECFNVMPLLVTDVRVMCPFPTPSVLSEISAFLGTRKSLPRSTNGLP